MSRQWVWLVCLALFLAACTPIASAPGDALPPTSQPVAAPAQAGTQTADPAPAGEPVAEAILILEPGPGSRLQSPIHVAGLADPTFEQNLVARILSEAGTTLAMAATTIQAEAGQRGTFSIDLSLQPNQEGPVFLQVYASSPRDGGITHLASSTILLSPDGPVEIKPVDRRSEQIQILSPAPGQPLLGGKLTVEGYGWASFEQTLMVALFDEQGTLLASQPVTISSQELGQPGPFRAELAYSLTAPQAGRVVVRDPGAAFDGDVHLASVEVRLEP